MARLGADVITVVRKPQVDRLKPVAGPAEEFDIQGCMAIPRASQEEGRGWVQTSGYTVYAPGGSDVKAEDQVRFRGQLYSVEGEPGDLRNKAGKRKALAITLEKVG